jgi:hypothetical protein
MGEYEQRIPHGGGANGHICYDTADDGSEELNYLTMTPLPSASALATIIK